MHKTLILLFVLFFGLGVNVFGQEIEKTPLNMVLVEGGSFIMGDSSYVAQEDEKPLHKVTVNSFYMDIYEVTMAEFEKFVKETKYVTEAERVGFVNDYSMESYEWVTKEGLTWRNDLTGKLIPKKEYNRPVANVSWNDANAFAKWAGKRLPTEAEWEYAARGGNKGKGFLYSGSDNIDKVAWYEKNSKNNTKAVGKKLPNELGIYDMTGNLWEWCSDWYGSQYYLSSPKRDPKGAENGTDKCLRGGSFETSAEGMRNGGFRNSQNPELKFYSYGFRCAKDVDSQINKKIETNEVKKSLKPSNKAQRPIK